MYTNNFNIKSSPFQEHPEIKNILREDRFERQMARLNYFRDNGRIAILTGATGVGKTTLIRSFLDNSEPRYFHLLHIHLSRLGDTALLRHIVSKIGETPSRERERVFDQLSEKAFKTKKNILLVIDEAHLLSPASLVDMRLLCDMSSSEGKPLFRILLSGQDDLLHTLRQDRFTDLRDRLCVRSSLYPLSHDETLLYIDRQMQKAGATMNVFSSEIGKIIYEYSGGIPRKINNAAIACLIATASEKAKKVEASHARNAIEELL